MKNKHYLADGLCFLLILFSLTSCKEKKCEFYSNGKTKSEYSLNSSRKIDGNYKEYYPNGKLKIKHIYENGVLKDSSVYFDTRGKLIEIHYHKVGFDYCKVYDNYDLKLISHEGYLKNGKKINKWKFYRGYKVSKIFEYIDSCGNQYTNQGWCFNKNGKLIDSGSNYYSFKIKNSIAEVGKAINFQAFYKPTLSKNSIVFICMSPKIEKNFCNTDKVKLDTVLPVNNKFNFDVAFTKKGKKNLRGFFNEIFYDKNNNKTGVRKVYFSIPILVR